MYKTRDITMKELLKLDLCNWKWTKSLSSYNRNVFYDTTTGEWFLEVCDEDYGDYLYYRSDNAGKEGEYIGFTNYEGSFNCVCCDKGYLELDPSMPT